MKKTLTLIAVIVLCFNLSAQNFFEDEQVVVTPDSLHLYFHGCSPHGERVVIANYTSEDLVVNGCYAENFHVECLYDGENIAETGMIIPIGETVILDTYATPYAKDIYGTLYIDTDFDIFTITIYYESTYSVNETGSTFSLSPNPANDFVNIEGENLGSISIFNMLGQKVEDFFTESENLAISTTHYPNGIYFAKTANGKTRRFVIAH
ncbi:MAG: T9SS type A sorting domain-containing protein [Bacteroidales bacterium]|nr:T9SS type A sorting domain-containing protein [Bacteroidales bacterium]